jgi:chitinase
VNWKGLPFFVVLLASTSLASQPRQGWVAAYFLGVPEGTPSDPDRLRPEQIDFAAVSHLIYFGAMARANGTLNTDLHGVHSDEARVLRKLTTAAGKALLLSVGIEAKTARGAASAAHRKAFVRAIVDEVVASGFDGVDIDWEPLEARDVSRYGAFIPELRAELDRQSKARRRSRYLLTSAVADGPELFGRLQANFDQINLMSYDLGGPWLGRVWYHSAILSRVLGGESQSSLDSMVDDFVKSGVPASKLGAGIAFYGYDWRGVAIAGQTWTKPPHVEDGVPYRDIARQFPDPASVSHDPAARASYISVDPPGSENDRFISFDDPAVCADKVTYARTRGLGGVMIWELHDAWIPERTPPDPLLQAVRQANGESGR